MPHSQSKNEFDAAMIVGLLTGLSILAWLVMLVAHARQDSSHLLLAWGAMTVGMMTPSAVPMITTYARLAPELDKGASVRLSVAVFTSAYLALWLVFAAVAATMQAGLQRLFLIDERSTFTSQRLSALFLIAAGLYQVTPLKQVCISKCRSPLGFLMGAYRTGYKGAFTTGLLHGVFCIGCCWLLMCLVWVGGMMNLVWMGVLSLVVIIEKSAPGAEPFTKWAGIALVLLGGVLLVTPRSDALMWDIFSSLCRSPVWER
jgi:predicted metal-binding membrane protein